LTFDGIRLGLFDYLFIVLIDEDSWLVSNNFKVSPDTVQAFLSEDSVRRFNWRRESRELSEEFFAVSPEIVFSLNGL
jgi:hypothetical protein